MFRCSLFLLAALALSAVSLAAQAMPLPPPPPGSVSLSGRGAPLPPRPMSAGGGGGPDFYEWHWALGALSRRLPAVTGAPYSADHITEVMRPTRPGAAPGMTPFLSERVYRDSDGRTRTERQPPVTPRQGMTFPPLVEIRDPVAGVVYILDMEASVAHRVAMDPAPAARGAVPLNLPPPPPRMSPAPIAHGPGVEDLGDQVIEGIVVHGTRRTVSIAPPPGRGGDAPLVQVTEIWRSDELHLDILTKTQTNSESTQKYVNISRDEPSTLLFAPPAEFRIVDEAGAGVAVSYAAQ